VERTFRELARAVVIAGYVVMALATVINFVTLASEGALGANVRSDVQLFSIPLASFAGVAAWWFLTQLAASDGIQLSLLRKGYVALGVQALFGSVTYLIIDFSFDVSSWSDLVFWLYAVGGVMVGVGFFLMTWSLRGRATLEVSDQPTPGDGSVSVGLEL
jgi:hypothetical protein